MGKQKLVRRKHIKWDYNGDGRFYTEKIPGFWKRYWKRWTRRKEKIKLEKGE